MCTRSKPFFCLGLFQPPSRHPYPHLRHHSLHQPPVLPPNRKSSFIFVFSFLVCSVVDRDTTSRRSKHLVHGRRLSFSLSLSALALSAWPVRASPGRNRAPIPTLHHGTPASTLLYTFASPPYDRLYLTSHISSHLALPSCVLFALPLHIHLFASCVLSHVGLAPPRLCPTSTAWFNFRITNISPE